MGCEEQPTAMSSRRAQPGFRRASPTILSPTKQRRLLLLLHPLNRVRNPQMRTPPLPRWLRARLGSKSTTPCEAFRRSTGRGPLLSRPQERSDVSRRLPRWSFCRVREQGQDGAAVGGSDRQGGLGTKGLFVLCACPRIQCGRDHLVLLRLRPADGARHPHRRDREVLQHSEAGDRCVQQRRSPPRSHPAGSKRTGR